MTDTYRCASCGSLNRVPERAGGRVPICGSCKVRLDVSGTPQAVNGAELRRVIAASPVLVLVDFWAAWCGPCRVAGPILERLAQSRKGKLITLKLDADKDPSASAQYRVEALPTFVAFKGGRELGRQAGLLPAPAFERWIDQMLHTAGAPHPDDPGRPASA